MMNKSYTNFIIRFYYVDDSVVPFYEFSSCVIIKFWYFPADQCLFLQSIYSLNDSVHGSISIFWKVLRYIHILTVNYSAQDSSSLFLP